jgi:hypothetical protein
MLRKLVVVLCLFLTGCADHVAWWSEDVTLLDGKVITIERKSHYTKNIFGQISLVPTFEELRYEKLGLVWKKKPAGKMFGFGIVDGVPWVVSYGDDNEICRNLPNEAPPLIFEYFDGKKWVVSRYDAAPLSVLSQNIFSFAPTETLKTKDKLHFGAKQFVPSAQRTPNYNILDYQDMRILFCVSSKAETTEKNAFYQSRRARKDQLLKEMKDQQNGK